TTQKRYSRDPITEAIIAFQVELAESVGLSELERCQDVAYPGRQVLMATEGEAGKAASASRPTPRQEGFGFSSADEKQVCQGRLDGFTVHRLAPYQGWLPFRDEARRLWDRYRQTVQPRNVRRVAIRYINRLDLPLPAELKDYLRTFVEVSPDLPQGVA